MSDLEQSLERREQRLAAVERGWVRGPCDLAYRAFTCAWLLACLARLSLFGELGVGWWASGLLLLVGAAGLIRFGGRLWWLISALALAWPLFFLRDWMTQSLVMMLIAVIGAATSRADSDGRQVRWTARVLVASTYWIAAFHKLNRDFFDADLSCASYGWEKLSIFFELLGLPASIGSGAAWAVVLTETLVGVLLLTRPRWGIILALLFHLPLTLVLAPAFVFIMGIGYAACLSTDDWEEVASTLTKHRLAVLLASACALLLPLLGDDSATALLTLKTALILGAAATIGASRSIAGERVAKPGRSWVIVPALFVAVAMSPYLGLQYQHAGAMLSNLRIDERCWNHLIVPESVRIHDPYVRIDEASMGPPEAADAFSEREAVLRDTLWQMSALGLIQRNWCRPHTQPIALRGTYLGEPFEVLDLCDPAYEPPRGVGALGGPEWFPNLLKFQKNLRRDCPTFCIH
jgi:hypothetical protein